MALCCKRVSRNVMEVLQSLRWIFLLIVLTDSVIGHVSDGGNLVQDATADGLSFISSLTTSTSGSSSSSPPPVDSPPFGSSSHNVVGSNKNLNSNNATSIAPKTAQQLQQELEDEEQKQLEYQRKGLPWIDKAASPNVTALLGKTAYLNCRVRNLADKTVSWIRHRDIHLLTVGRYTYTTDQRFRSVQQPSTEDHSLIIKYPQHRDSGIYECQVSTTLHISHFVHLSVVGE